MITTARKMFFMHKGISRGAWQYFKPNAHLGIELKSKTLGIYGLGRIGMKMAERCKGAYNMDIIYHNRNRNSKAEKELAAQYVSFQELLQGSDVLSVHCALTKETRRIFNTSAFEQMKSTAIFINTSRGAVHHEQDLHEALQNGQIWGAGLDVTDPEPMLPDNPLLEMENVSILPHIGSATIEARHKMSEMVVSNIIAFFNGDKIPYLVNPEVFH
jgi:glyoxylate reductase